jgi:hypothetical protein
LQVETITASHLRQPRELRSASAAGRLEYNALARRPGGAVIDTDDVERHQGRAETPEFCG